MGCIIACAKHVIDFVTRQLGFKTNAGNVHISSASVRQWRGICLLSSGLDQRWGEEWVNGGDWRKVNGWLNNGMRQGE